MRQFDFVIHPTAIIHSKAKLASTVRVGPYAVIDEGVTLGDRCVVGPHVYLTGQSVIGSDNIFHAGCVIGDAPQDLKYHGEPTGLIIGDQNVFREHVTIHRSNKTTESTIIGSDNLLMAHCHVGHNSLLGNHIIIANGSMLGGHVVIQDRAFLSGNCLVHQFIRVGTLAFMRGGAAITKDLAPFTVARDFNRLTGLNVIGLRRAGLTPAERMELKRAYLAIFRSGKNLRAAVNDAQVQFTGASAQTLLQFIKSSARGVCTDHRSSLGKERENED